MVLHRARNGPCGSRFLAEPVRFPGKHHASVTIGRSTAAGSVEAVGTIIDHRTGDALVQQQHGRVHPQLRIPENMPVVTLRRESHRRDAQPRSRAARSVKVVECETHDTLRLVVALDLDVALPHLLPEFAVSRQHPVDRLVGDVDDLAFGFAVRIAEITGRTDGPDKRETLRFACFQAQAERRGILRSLVSEPVARMNEHRRSRNIVTVVHGTGIGPEDIRRVAVDEE